MTDRLAFLAALIIITAAWALILILAVPVWLLKKLHPGDKTP